MPILAFSLMAVGIGTLIIYGLISLLTLVTLPFVTRGLASAQGILAGTAALNAEGHSRRQLERDIHDGPQQQLLRLQMDLALAQRHIDQDPDNAAQMLGQALTLAQQTLDDLWRLSKGIAPPLLQDRGLVVALRAPSHLPGVGCRACSREF